MASLFKYIQLIPFVFLSIFVLSSCDQPEPRKPDPVRRKSPIAIAKVTHEASDTYIKVVYGQPYKKGREIFGNLVPYDEVWRTGANEATELTTTGNILFGGNELEAGTYALFTIPHENEPWTIILNDELGQWGDFEYNPQSDVMRIKAPSMKTQTVTEVFTIHFSDIVEDSTNMVLNWDQMKVKIPIEFLE